MVLTRPAFGYPDNFTLIILFKIASDCNETTTITLNNEEAKRVYKALIKEKDG